ncbi:MAG: hypothetical protein COA57_05635 [Flavobacteriales bacterium]|nr:MAG: hypothetical protein COA57_05635 [Flavobacteriales bacterium]
MKKASPILLLFVTGMLIFPWRSFEVCIAHPMGHHHHHNGPSPCELRKTTKGTTSYLPPMECFKFFVYADDYLLPSQEQLKPDVQSLVIASKYFDLVKFPLPQNVFISMPEPRGNSDPPLSNNTLRGPPLS